MSRNLFGISAKDLAIRAASCLYAIVVCQAIIHDTNWLWILSIAGGLIIIALSRAPLHLFRTKGPAFNKPFSHLPPSTERRNSHKPGPRTGVPPSSGTENGPRASNRQPGARPFVYQGRLQTLDGSALLGVQPVLFNSPPICLN